MRKPRQVVRFLLDSFWNLILNDTANLLGGSLVMLLGVLILICFIAIFRLLQISIFSMPIYLFLMAALVGLIIAMAVYSIPNMWRRVQWTGRRDVAGFSWEFHYGELVSGPFCVHCGGSVEELSGDLDSRYHSIMAYHEDVFEHTCGGVIPQTPDMNAVRENVAAAVVLHIKLGISVSNSLSDSPYFSS